MLPDPVSFGTEVLNDSAIVRTGRIRGKNLWHLSKIEEPSIESQDLEEIVGSYICGIRSETPR